MYCNRCGATINDLNKPCPTCGMMPNNMNLNVGSNGYMNNGVNYSVNNNQRKRSNGIVTFIIVGVVVMGLFFLTSVIGTAFSTIEANKDSGVYEAINYTLKYNPQMWYKYKSDSEMFVLRNRNDDKALFLLPTEYTLLGNFDLTSDYDRKYIHDELLKGFRTTSEIRYSNIMSEVKNLPGTSYYYMTADFYSLEGNYSGRAYVIISERAQALLCLLREGSKDVNELENEVFALYENLTM